MKKLWPSVACSAVLLSGCMYGSASAPITALNSNQNQPSRAPVGQIYVPQGQAVALTPTPTATPRPAPAVPQPVRVAPAQPVQPQQNTVQPQQNMVVQAQSPYSQPAVVQAAQPQSSNDDGWSVAPQSAQGQASAQQIANNSNQNQQNTNQAQPVRPVEAQPATASTNTDTVANTAPPVAPVTNSNNATNDSQAASQNQQVASATPPQQPAAPAKEDTAVKVLIKKANEALGREDRDGAVAYLENAQRIAPQDPRILYDIANIRYHQGRYKDAETFAGRAVQVGGDNRIMKKSWALVANARKSLGDNQGAIAAAEKAASLGN